MPVRRRRRYPVRRTNEHHLLGSRGGSRGWTRLVKQVVTEEPWCWLRLPGCTGRSQTADHVLLRKHRPDLTDKRWNLRGACHWCNRHRKDTPVWELPKLRKQMEAQLMRRVSRSVRALQFFEKE
jgi:hypothetical protein